MTERKMSWKVLKIFAHECYSDDLGFTSTVFLARSSLLSGLLCGKSS